MNVSEGTKRFQVDTGPVLLPDFTAQAKRAVEKFHLAFICYNTFDAAEVVLRQPTPVVVDGKEVGQVMHYARIVRLAAKHEIFCAAKI